MSKYTTEVRFICESNSGLLESAGYASVNDILKKSAPKIFNFDFPIFDESYRLPLEIKILKHYYTREIGAETVGLWKLWLDQRMNEIMPIYNERYKLKTDALKDKVKLFNNVDLQTTRTTEDTGNTSTKGSSKSSGTSSSTSKDMYSETPQGALHGVDTLTYLTDYRRIEDESSESANGENTTNTDVTNTQTYIEHITGRNGGRDYMELYAQAYNDLVNIDTEIIDELSDLFFGLW